MMFRNPVDEWMDFFPDDDSFQSDAYTKLPPKSNGYPATPLTAADFVALVPNERQESFRQAVRLQDETEHMNLGLPPRNTVALNFTKKKIFWHECKPWLKSEIDDPRVLAFTVGLGVYL